MCGSRPAAASATGSPDSFLWWSPATRTLQQQAQEFRAKGDFAGAEYVYRQGYQSALVQHDNLAAVRFLMSAGSCQLLAANFRGALVTLLESRRLADSISATAEQGAIAV